MGPLLDFFWSWRFLARSVLAVINTPLPQARVFHAVATGFSGLVGSYAKLAANLPLLVTEHGIYTNERRIELAVADWLFDSGAGGYVTAEPIELRSIWSNAFQCFSRVSYAVADVITTQYRANQNFQRTDGAPDRQASYYPQRDRRGQVHGYPARHDASAADGADGRAHRAHQGRSHFHHGGRAAQGTRAECGGNPDWTGG